MDAVFDGFGPPYVHRNNLERNLCFFEHFVHFQQVRYYSTMTCNFLLRNIKFYLHDTIRWGMAVQARVTSEQIISQELHSGLYCSYPRILGDFQIRKHLPKVSFDNMHFRRLRVRIGCNRRALVVGIDQKGPGFDSRPLLL